ELGILIDAQIAACMVLLRQGRRQCAVATTQIKDGIPGSNIFEQWDDARLGLGAALREVLGEALVEFAVELQEESLHFGFHGLIIRLMTQTETWEYRVPTAEQLSLARSIL
ncbi:MAG: hypothetical protein GWN58_31520, partial [Anaerolineae bacterium]|nr:hypothetical protein [Anaerolineae bacterium]